MSAPSHPVDGERRVSLLQVLGRGGFGAVYLADLHSRDGFVQRVAVKILNARMTESADIAARQRDEARLLARLNHDHIVKVFDLTEVQNRPSVIMEYVEGVDLGQLVREAPLPTKVALQAIGQAASALHAAWESPDPQSGNPLRVVHRDIKPSNLLLSRHGNLKVLDFGIARGDFDREGATGSVQFGTSRFMAPEQWLYQAVSNKVDVYALGVTLVELLAGAALERAPLDPERFRLHMDAAIYAVVAADLPQATKQQLADLCTQMLAYDPADRPSAAEVRETAMAIVEDLSGEGLVRYARRTVPPLLQRQDEDTETDPLLTPANESRSTLADAGISVRRLTPLPDPASFTPSAAAEPTFAWRSPDGRDSRVPVVEEPNLTAFIHNPAIASPPDRESDSSRPRPWWGIATVLVALFLGTTILWAAYQLRNPEQPLPAPEPTAVNEEPTPRDPPTPTQAPQPEVKEPPPTTEASPPAKTPAAPDPRPTGAPQPAPPPVAPAPKPAPTPEPAPETSEPSESLPTPSAPDAAALPGTGGTPVTLTSTPIGASVTVDGRTLPSSTPVTLSLPRGSHTIVITKEGQSCTKTISVNAFSARTFRCNLANQTMQTLR